jgi:hypothetical protein|tara:strand:+ start:850 stop:1269 length:420 start_codon:yes stop_codon:yes gene_type:complete
MIEHGSFELEITGNVLILRAFDSWNYQTASRWVEETKELASHLKSNPWLCICDLTQWELATPDIHYAVLDLNLWLDENNLRYLAIVHNSALQKAVLQKSHEVFRNVEVEYFSNLDEGYAWLESVSNSIDSKNSKASNHL